MRRQNVLIVCNDVIGLKMAGPAIRCVEIAKVLSRSFDVEIYAPKVQQLAGVLFETKIFSNPDFKSAAENADFLIVQGDALRSHPFLKGAKGCLVVDLYCPVPLEYHQASEGVSLEARGMTSNFLCDVLHEQLVYGDHFLCASEKQREFWLGALTLAGRINAYRWPQASHADVSDLISLLPFGLSSKRPEPTRRAIRSTFDIPADDFVLVWGGGLYQWFDPLTPIKAVQHLISEGTRVHLVFIGVKHPNASIAQHDMCARAVDLATELGLINKFVHFNFGWVDYDDRHNFLLDADAGISSHFNNPETRFSFRTRMLDYLWCDLPIIATQGDVFGDSLLSEGIGISVGFEDFEGWVQAIKVMMTDKNEHEKYRVKIREYSKNFIWSSVVSPFLERLETMIVAPDRSLVRSHYVSANQSTGFFFRLRRLYTLGGIRSIFSAVWRRLR